jgi:hypothetical protein
MKLQVEGKSYNLRFMYAEDRKWADCLITDEETKVVTPAVAKNQSYTAGDKELIRREAFAKAVRKLTPDRDLRRKFWFQYTLNVKVPDSVLLGIALQNKADVSGLLRQY